MSLTGLKQKVPWWLKVSGKIILSRMPANYGLWQRVGLFRHGYMDQTNYAYGVFNAHVVRSGLEGKLKGKTILELGPGDSIASAIIAFSHGAQAVLVDAGPFAKSTPGAYSELVKHLADLGLTPPEITDCMSLNEILSACNAQYLTSGLESLLSIPDNSIDLIFSQAVLEHIFRTEFLPTQRECSRILRQQGVCSHRIDLRDHLGGGLNNLRFSERIWESSFFTRSGFYTNRIQLKKMIDLFEQANFQVKIGEVRCWDQLPIARQKLAREFQQFTDDELRVSGFDVVLRPSCGVSAVQKSAR